MPLTGCPSPATIRSAGKQRWTPACSQSARFRNCELPTGDRQLGNAWSATRANGAPVIHMWILYQLCWTGSGVVAARRTARRTKLCTLWITFPTAGDRSLQGILGASAAVSRSRTPEEYRAGGCPARWVSTMPMASISANMVVGPTKENPCFRSALDSATDSGDCVGISAWVTGWGVVGAGTARRSQPGRPARAGRWWPGHW